MNDPGFKDQFCAECCEIPVGKKDRLLAIYPSIKERTRLFNVIDKKD